jgi:hypothetical protein
MPIWVAETPTNRSAAEALWRAAFTGLPATMSGAITTFKVRPSESPSAWALAILGDIDLHHGELSHTPAYSVLEVFGTTVTPDLREALEKYGLTEVESRVDGFRASAPSVT